MKTIKECPDCGAKFEIETHIYMPGYIKKKDVMKLIKENPYITVDQPKQKIQGK